jgi:hypothetical protein
MLVAIVYKIRYKPGYRSCDLLKNSSALIGGKFIFQKKSFKDLLSSLNAVISTNERNEFITDHMTCNPSYR